MENKINFDSLFRLMDSPVNDRNIDKLIKKHYESNKHLEGKYFDLLISKIKAHSFNRLSKERIEKVIIWCEKEKIRVIYSLKKSFKDKYWLLIIFLPSIATFFLGRLSKNIDQEERSLNKTDSIKTKIDTVWILKTDTIYNIKHDTFFLKNTKP